LRVLRNADASKDADDGNDNQQFYEPSTSRGTYVWQRKVQMVSFCYFSSIEEKYPCIILKKTTRRITS
jgi:hypothetical protein